MQPCHKPELNTEESVDEEDCVPLDKLRASIPRPDDSATQTHTRSCTSGNIAKLQEAEWDEDGTPLGDLVAAKYTFGKAHHQATASFAVRSPTKPQHDRCECSYPSPPPFTRQLSHLNRVAFYLGCKKRSTEAAALLLT